MRALVTGGSGFLGGQLAAVLHHRGYRVTVLDCVAPDYVGVPHFIKHDISQEFPKVKPLGYDVIFHCAGLLGSGTLFDKIRRTAEVNIVGTINVLDWALGNPDITIVQPNLMGEWLNPYMITKQTAERIGLMYARYIGSKYLSIRPTDVYGPRQSLRDNKAASTFITRAIKGEPLPIYGSGTSWVNYIYVNDVANFMVAAYEAGAVNEVIDFCYPGGDITVVEFARRVIEAAESDSRLEYKPMRPGQPGDMPVISYDLSRASELYDMSCLTTLDEGLKVAVKWYRIALEENII
jgi:nucleoside-diphosphate-sugar epimerase